MTKRFRIGYCVFLGSLLATAPVGLGQITSNSGDGVLNAPYRGTVTSLRVACENLAYGEVRTWIEPQTNLLISGSVQLWIDDPTDWDRSIIRLYEGLDASGPEIRLDQSSPSSHLSLSTDADQLKRLSIKAIATKTLAPLTFRFRFSYSIQGGGSSSGTRTFVVAPMTASFTGSSLGLPEAFQLGTELLRVSVGAAGLVVPVGRTAEMIGSTYEFRDNDGWTGSGSSRKMHTTDALLPGAAESVYVPQVNQFRLNHSSFTKSDWGTPWSGQLTGFYNQTDTFGPDGTHYDSFNTPSSTVSTIFRRYERIRPFGAPDNHPASVVYEYTGGDRVVVIRDQATPNYITLTRPLGPVERITTSDGRGWDIESNDPNGWITGIVPDSGEGARYFEYNSAGRVTRVKDAQNDVLYEFVYVNDATGSPTILQAERRLVDGTLQTVVEHEVVSPTLERRKEYVAAGQYRQYDFVYDGARLVSRTSYRDLNGAGPAYTTTYVRDTENAAGTVKLTQVQLPDTTTIQYEYDAHEQQAIEPDPVHFGFRTKTAHTGTSGSLVTYDATYEFFYNDGVNRLFWRPRVVKERDGRYSTMDTEVVFDYENGGTDQNSDGLNGEQSNQLFSRTGPTITNVDGLTTRTPQTTYEYYGQVTDGFRRLHFVRTKYDATHTRDVERTYDPLLRLRSEKVDPNGLNVTTQYLYCDASATQDRITVDADGYWTRRQFDPDGRLAFTEQFLDVNAGNVNTPCVSPTGKFYQTAYAYDANGYLDTVTVDNKDQAGDALTPATIVTDYTPDDLGRVVLRKVDPTGIGQETHTDYNWLGEIEREYDTSGRGRELVYDGRGLVSSEIPLKIGQSEVASLTTIYTYDAMGRLDFTYPPTDPFGPNEERVYDDFGRLEQLIRHPGSDGGDLITTTYEYDAASNITRTYTEDTSFGILSDATAKYDEGGFNYESRQRTVAGADDNADDPVTQRQFDWAGNVTVETSLGDATVDDRVITTQYDGANRILRVLDSEDGETWNELRDGRGNITQQKVKLASTDYAVTNTQYDALGRAIQTLQPEDHYGLRHYTKRWFNSRGNLLRETGFREAGVTDVPVQTSVFAYDNAGRTTHSAILEDPNDSTPADQASLADDRVVKMEYDADGRLRYRRTYNNNDGTTALTTETTYDDVGRIDRITDPAGNYTDTDYDSDGRLTQRTVFDGLGTRVLEATVYDGHDRVLLQRALGTPNLSTLFEYDGLDRPYYIEDPNSIGTYAEFDLVGRRQLVWEDAWGLLLQRETLFDYNRQSQLIVRTAENRDSDGAALDDQVTTYRYDSLGRQTRVVYPDAPAGDRENPDTCTDCVRMTYDLAGRMTQRQDQRNTTVYAYDDRGLLETRTTGTTVDTFDQDALGRTILAERGTITNEDVVAKTEMAYTGLGDLDHEIQTIAEGATRTVDYGYDQAGNRTSLTYPGGTVLIYAPTALNQVDTITLGASPLVDYGYTGWMLQTRTTTTSAPGGSTTYEQEWGYDSHRRVNGLTNRVDTGSGPQTIAEYAFTHDRVGNPLSQIVVTGQEDFLGDDRLFWPDRLNRLTATDYLGSGESEETVLDLVGNREVHVNRQGETTEYALANAANEYATIDGGAVQYDGTGNLSVDEEGRQYSYDEQNRLVQVKAADQTVLANYTYDALGRRVTFHDALAGRTTRYYYAGPNVIEERDGSDVLLAYHLNGSQYVDERVATFDTGAGGLRAAGWTYYLLGNNYSVAGTGNADGSVVERLEYAATGDLTGPPSGRFFDADADDDIDLDDWVSLADCLFGPTVIAEADCLLHDFGKDQDVDVGDAGAFQRYFTGSGGTASLASLRSGNYAHDADYDRDVDLDDYAVFAACLDTPVGEPLAPLCLAVFDFDDAGLANGSIDLDDFYGFQLCFSDAGQTPPDECFRPGAGGAAPTHGAFALHGAMLDVLSDPDGPTGPQTALSLQNSRARYFDLKHGRFLQRDRKGYVDGGNLYEAFRGNAMRFSDPYGTQSSTERYLDRVFEDPERAERWSREMHEGLKQAPTVARLGLLHAVGTNDDLSQMNNAQLDVVIEKELTNLAGAVILLRAHADPSFDFVLRQGLDPDVYAMFGRQERRELSLGYVQGAAYAAEGTTDIVIDLANLGLDLGANQYIVLISPDAEIEIPRLRFAPEYINVSDRTKEWSRFLGGNAILILGTEGLAVVRSGSALAGTEGAETTISATRARVLANIAESRAARASSNIDVLFAKEAQLRAGYGMDVWSMTTLPKGSIVYGGIPGQSAFYTDAATVIRSGGSRTALFQSVQGAPHPLWGYRPAVSMYEVLQDIRIPTGAALGNPGLGAGGGRQFFIWNYSKQLREVPYIPLGQ